MTVVRVKIIRTDKTHPVIHRLSLIVQLLDINSAGNVRGHVEGNRVSGNFARKLFRAIWLKTNTLIIIKTR